MLIPSSEVEKFDQLIEAREGLKQDVLAQRLSSQTVLKYYEGILQGLRRSEQESSFWHDEEVFAQLSKRLAEMYSLGEDWDSYGAPVPAPRTIANAAHMLAKLRLSLLLPEIVAPSAEGGVAIYFSQGTQKAFIEFLNEGDVLLARYGKDDEPNVKVLRNGLQDLNDQALQEIRDHLGARA
jgi:hypothetical protein